MQEKTYQIKQQTHKHANTKQRTEEQQQRNTESTDIENILEKNVNGKRKNDNNNRTMTNKGYPSPRDQQAGYEI